MLRRVFKAFQYRDFRLMWIGACTSTIGTFMQVFAQGWLIYNLSHSAFLLALDQVLQATPIFLFSLIGGVVADRIERRHLLMFSQWVQMACAATLTLLVGFHVIQVWHMLACSCISGFAQAFGGPAYQALIPNLVDKDDVPNAISLISIQFNAAVLVGPALGGVAFAKLGATWCFGLNSLSFLAPIIALSLLSVRFLPVKTGETILDSLKQGVQFIRERDGLGGLMVLAFFMTALAVPSRTFLPVFAKDIFHRGSDTYALFLSVSGAGSIVGALTVAWLGNIRNKGRVALTMMICLGGAIAGFAVSPLLPASCAMLFLSGLAMIAVFTSVNSLVQLIVTNEMRGPRDERVQLLLPQRNAAGQPGVRMAGAGLHGSGGDCRQRRTAGRDGAVLSDGATARGCAVIRV